MDEKIDELVLQRQRERTLAIKKKLLQLYKEDEKKAAEFFEDTRKNEIFHFMELILRDKAVREAFFHLYAESDRIPVDKIKERFKDDFTDDLEEA
jgi:hypothetical protein